VVIGDDAIVPQLPPALDPGPDERGLATGDVSLLAEATLRAWDLFLAAAESADLGAPARAHGWTGVDVLLILGDWPENRTLGAIVGDAQAGLVGEVDQSGDVARVHAAHAGATPEEAIAAVRRGRESLAAWFADPAAPGGPDEVGLLPTRSLLGTLPVLTLLHATTYQVAVSALDLEACGAQVPDELVTTGLRALLDTTGALAARAGVTASLVARTPSVVVGAAARGPAWRTADVAPDLPGPAIVAEARTILDITSGRASNVPGLYRSGDLRVVDLPGLLALAPVISDVPGIPGGAALGRALSFMNGVGTLLGRLPFGRA
jgi:hypothetical protein